MSRFTNKVALAADGQTRDDAARLKVSRQAFERSGTSIKLRWFCAALLLAIAPFAAESADDIKPPVGYRNWFHVNAMVVDKASPLFEVLGGIHDIYVNSTGEPALKKRGPYPDKTILVDDVHDFNVVDGSYVQGPPKALAVMIKDKKKYASTGGWAFQAWAGGDPKKPLVTDPTKQCFECHQARKDQEYVYSTYVP